MKVEIEEYNPAWKNMFDIEKDIIENAFQNLSIKTEHIGSTSITGLGAKPVIDILIGVNDRKTLDELPTPLINAGYIYVKKYEDVLPERKYFIKVKNSFNEVLPNTLFSYNDKINRTKFPHLFHIHGVVFESTLWKRYIGFRDYLIKNKDERERYCDLKKTLANQDWDSVNDYADAKTEFVKSIEAKAGIH